MLQSTESGCREEGQHCRRRCRSLTVVLAIFLLTVTFFIAQSPYDPLVTVQIDGDDDDDGTKQAQDGGAAAVYRQRATGAAVGDKNTVTGGPSSAAAHASKLLSSLYDCTVEPCGWWGSAAFRDGPLFASEYEAARRSSWEQEGENAARDPQPNEFHCRDVRDKHPCRSEGERGHTLLYRHRHRYRSTWKDPFEFDQSPGNYDDFGHASPTGGDGGDADDDFRVADRVDAWCRPTDKVLVTATIKKGYGLTNRLLSLSGHLALAARTGRIPAVDAGKKIRVPIHLLLNLSRSLFPWNRLRRIAVFCNYTAPIVMPKRMAPHSLQVIDRKQVALRPHKVMHLFDQSFRSVTHAPLVYMHEMYLRYPFEQERDWRLHAAALFCGMQFADWIHDAGIAVVRGIRNAASAHYATPGPAGKPPSSGSSSSYAAWHLRLEVSDAIAMRKGRKQTTSAHVVAFVEGVVAPLLRKHGIRTLLVCAGPLPQAIQRALVDVTRSLGIRLIRKEDVLPKDVHFDDFHTLGSVRERTGDGSSWTTPTATDGAAVDAVALEKADLVLMTTVSSFSAFVYAKRCGGNRPVQHHRSNRSATTTMNADDRDAVINDARRRGCTMVGGFYLYDTYLDGSLTDAIYYPCGYQFHAYLAAPPALIRRPPEELDVFAFRFLPVSPLFTDAQRNVIPGEAPPAMEQP